MNPSIDPHVRSTFVYWMFDERGSCLYVGMTRRPEARWRDHGYMRPKMIERVAYRKMAGPFTQPVARRLEREQQDALQPEFDSRLALARERQAWQEEVGQ